MKNKFKKFLLITIIFLSNNFILHANEQFNFDVTEVEITEKGNKFIGKKRGLITTQDNIEIEADQFEYNKISNILKLTGNVKIKDFNQDSIIYSKKITYYKNQEIYKSESSSKFINTKDNIEIEADQFKYDKISNILELTGDAKIIDIDENAIIYSQKITYFKNQELFESELGSKFINKEFIINSDKMKYNKILNSINANGNVKIDDKKKKYKIYANDINYLRNVEKIFTKGKTRALINSEYDFNSYDVQLLRNENILSSKKKSTILDKKSKLYEIDSFEYNIESELLKAKNLYIVFDSLVSSGESDNLKFDDGIFNLKDNSYIASKTEINLKKNSFDNTDNDPRLIGASSRSKNQITNVNKGIFTSCKKIDGKCPPWSIKAKKITHDKIKKQLIYDHAILNVYDKPVMYFPKFFHPDPTVERQSGFLRPQLNNSDILGTSIYMPYFHVISENKDFTFKPTWFDNDIYMLQNEYREENKNSSFIADFSVTKGYKSSLSNNKNSISHLFAKYDLDLNLSNFDKSQLNFFLEKVTNDTYLKVFDTNLIDTPIKPSNPNMLNTGLTLTLDHEKFNFDLGLQAYENLQIEKSSDRYQYILPYYNFSKFLETDGIGSIEFTSSGNNNLIETNNLESNIINNLNYKIIDQISNQGFKNNFGIYFKNLNTVAKNNNKYKSSPQMELMNIIEFNSSLPLGKKDLNSDHIIEPKISLRFNPGDMKNYNSTKRIINADNIFDIDRLGLSDSFEAGKSLTLGIDYKKTDLNDINKYFEAKISTVLRDKKENFVPSSSTINNKNSNLFGSITYNHDDHFKFDYDFAIDNDFSTFNYNTISSEFTYNNFTTELKFIEENDIIGNSNSIENRFEYELNKNNYLSFNTRRNRTLNLTEYYDLLYEYKNDCLTAGFKYKRSYYQDRDLKPKEDLLLTITFYPLTTYEQEVDQNLYRGDNAIDDDIKKLFN
tara:strand:- start:2828 stop:5689 length:2862 start_codon:yes stop_codon:yes gene_type:complete